MSRRYYDIVKYLYVVDNRAKKNVVGAHCMYVLAKPLIFFSVLVVAGSTGGK